MWCREGATAEKGRAVPNLINRRARFKLRDVCIPPVDELLALLYGEEIVEGTVVDASNSGTKRQAFVVVQLSGVDTLVVVPTELILSITWRLQVVFVGKATSFKHPEGRKLVNATESMMRASDASDGLFWYAIQTKPKQEHRAEQTLRALNLETFVPTTRERSSLKIGTGGGYRLAPLFPGYIFARFGVEQHLWRVRMTSGVHDVISFGNGPARIDSDVIALLRERTAEMATRGRTAVFVSGDHVIVQDGPLRNLVGIFEREMNGCERVAVLLSAIHWRVRTVVDMRNLIKVNAP